MTTHAMPSSAPIPTGKLTTGSVGAFMLATGLVLNGLIFLMSFRGNASATEGYLFLMAPLMLIGGVLSLFGYLGFQRVFRGGNVVAGVFALLAGLGGAGVLLIPLLGASGPRERVGFAMLGFFVFSIAAALYGIVAGITALTSRDGRPAGALRAAGVLLLLGGLGAVPMALALAEVIPPGQWVAMVSVVSAMLLGIGTVLTGTTMLSRRREA
ncbi:MAG: hypothetical protein KC635_17080 [Myxococcales bacterium]|nr:hypothetical protein [Myxococcales bacterium]MCB9736054.1 hypothetical protein [Deltaproteobacteria bacterium]